MTKSRHRLTQRHLASPNPAWALCGERLRVDVADRGMAWFEGRMQDIGYEIAHVAGEPVTCPHCVPRFPNGLK